MKRNGSIALPRPDFAPHAPRGRRLSYAFLALMAVWLIGVTADVIETRERAAGAIAERTRWERVRAKQSAQQTRMTAPPVSEDVRRKAERISDGLRFPWGTLLAAVEASAPTGVQWLTLEMDRERGSLRLEGTAADTQLAIETADALAGQPDLSQVVLTRLSSVDRTAAQAQRFDIDVRVRSVAVTP